MNLEQIGQAVWGRVAPAAVPDVGTWTVVAVGIALAAVVVPLAWRLTRVAVTIVHELGHAAVGILVGRRFTGFVVRGDMSGHAVTRGPRRGPGTVASVWAGYPAPALAGALLVTVAFNGWAGTALSVALLALVLSLVFARSLHTLVAVLASIAAVGAAWWWGDATLQAALALGAGIFLLLGAWRHLGAVARSGGRGDDPAQLARITPLPAWAWTGTFLAAVAACTWWAWTALAATM